MKCPECQSTVTKDDIYCSKCGADLAVSSTGLVPVQKNLPALLYNLPVPRGVAASVGAVAVGMGLELLRRGLLARLAPSSKSVESALPALTGIKDLLLPQNNKKLPRGYEVHETVVYMRRVIRRED
jgi:hypothetical protein